MPETLAWQAAQAAAPHLKIATLDAWVAALSAPMTSSGITTPGRIAAFFGQISVESGGFTELVENLEYSAARAAEVWPSHFPDAAAAQPYAYQPERLANVVYAARNGNGDVASGDGWLFRGRGLIQLTGRANYMAFAVAMHRSSGDAVDWIAQPAGAAAAACWFWSIRGLNTCADAWDIAALTRRINGGATGYQQRLALSNAALRALHASPAVAAPAEPAGVTADTSADLLMQEEEDGHLQLPT
jgi:putative chitinase